MAETKQFQILTKAQLAPKANQIVESAREIFLRDGFANASVDVIARAAGVSKATVYAHFASKEGLFGAVVANECQRHSLLVPTEEIEMSSPRAALLQIGRNFAELVLAPHVLTFYRMVVAEAGRKPEIGRVYYMTGPNNVIEWLAASLRLATEQGHLKVPDARLAATQFFTMIRGDLYLRRLFGVGDIPKAPDAEQLVSGAVDVFMKAYGPST